MSLSISITSRSAVTKLSTITDYCMLINEWAWLRSRICLLSLKVHLGSIGFGVRAQTEMKVWYVKGMHLLKVISSEKM